MEEAAYVVADRPAGGWDSLVTKEHLSLELAALRHELRAEFAESFGSARAESAESSGSLRAELHREIRAQTWRLATALFATLTAMTAIIRLT